jgi:hypothetical protein
MRCWGRGSSAWRVEPLRLLRGFASPYSPECVEEAFSEVRVVMIYTQRRTLTM